MRQPSNNKPRRRRVDNIQKFTVKADAPLLEAVAAVLKDHKPTKLKSMLRHHQFAVNGTPTSQFDRPVNAGDELWVNFDGSFHVFTHPKLKLVYEDEDIMVVDKAYGMLSTAAGNNIKDETVYNVLRKYVKLRSEHARVYMVHRLDRDTSGLLVYAKTLQAEQILEHNWRDIVTDRRYLALVSGELPQRQGSVESWLKDNKAYFTYSSPVDNGGKYALTHYRVLRTDGKHSLVELKLETGRKNQIRVHMQDLGHPVCGDIKYGNGDDPIGRLALHAYRLNFYHPMTGEPLRFETPVPKGFRLGTAQQK